MRVIRTACLVVLVLFPNPVRGQSSSSDVALTVDAGRPLEIVLDRRMSIREVGQSVSGTLVEPLYAYDQLVVPAGTRVLGHIAAIEGLGRFARMRAMLSGDLTPARHIVLVFETLLPADANPVAIHTVVKTEIPHLKRTSAPPDDTIADAPNDAQPAAGRVRQAERAATNHVREAVSAGRQRARDVIAEVKQPGRIDRLKDAVVQRLPYHPQMIDAGTGDQAELIEPLNVGPATSTESAPASARPTPSSHLRARLTTPMDSASTARGTPVEAILTEPVFSADHRLIYPEGTRLDGEVTWAVPARRFHRNGQLRFLIERVHRPDADASTLLASVDSVQGSEDDHLTIDDEGGVTSTNAKT
jgi:hypothetical protein